jgi:hypothetical protein
VKREPSVHKSVRIPLSTWTRFESLLGEGADFGAFVKDCLDKGLAEIEAGELKGNT